MSQVAGNYDNNGVPLPSVEVKPVEATNNEPIPQQGGPPRGWFARAFDDFGLGFISAQAATATPSSSSTSKSFDFSSLIQGGENSDKTNQLLLQLFIFIGLMVVLLFAFKFFKK